MSSFLLEYKPLTKFDLSLGEVAEVPWDTEIFKFKIGQYKLINFDYSKIDKQCLGLELDKWCKKNQIIMIGCNIESSLNQAVILLQELNFFFVDSIVKVQLNNFKKLELQKPRFKIRQIEVRDYAAVKKIAEISFKHGRYFADFRFPKDLARLRYKRWIEMGIENISENNKIYVLEIQKDIKGFFYVVFKNNKTVYLSLAAVKPEQQHGILGYHLYLAVLNKLKDNCIEKVEGSVSLSNISTINLLLSFGFTCNRNELIFHKFSQS